MNSFEAINIPLVFVALVLHQKAFTPPNPPPSKRASENLTEKTMFRMLGLRLALYKITAWFIGCAEICLLLARLFPGKEVSAIILKCLMFGGDPSQVQMTLPSFVGLGLVIAGSLLRLSCYRALGQLFTYQVSVQKEHKLVTIGPYSVIRHPSYTGIFLVYAGLFIWQSSSGSWLRESGILQTWGGKAIAMGSISWFLTYGYAFISRTKVEDNLMAKHFGEEWHEWEKRVPYRLLPYLY